MSSGDFGGGVTPGPIPNPVVKPACADGTWGVAPWESRSSPEDSFYSLPSPPPILVFVVLFVSSNFNVTMVTFR